MRTEPRLKTDAPGGPASSASAVRAQKNLIFCAPIRPRAVYVEGRAVVDDHRLLSADTNRLHDQARAAIARLAN